MTGASSVLVASSLLHVWVCALAHFDVRDAAISCLKLKDERT